MSKDREMQISFIGIQPRGRGVSHKAIKRKTCFYDQPISLHSIKKHMFTVYVRRRQQLLKKKKFHDQVQCGFLAQFTIQTVIDRHCIVEGEFHELYKTCAFICLHGLQTEVSFDSPVTIHTFPVHVM